MALETVTLSDASTGSTAKILVDFGLNCYSFQAVHEGNRTEVLWSHPDFASGKERPSGSGIPLLFPFAGRIRGTVFEFGSKKYHLEPGDALGNAIHGFVLDRPWRVLEQTAGKLIGQFQASIDAPSLLECWPADFCITATYTLEGNMLKNLLCVENPGEDLLPFGLGTHPYFRILLGAQGKTADCTVTVPATKYWELNEMLPTGRLLAASERGTLGEGIALDETQFDDVFSGLEHRDGMCTATLSDSGSGRTMKMMFDKSFGQCVVYNPPHREAICIEPLTSVPDMFTLSARGIQTGMNVLEPGGTFRATISICLQ